MNGSPLWLDLTIDRKDGKVIVQINGKSVELPYGSFRVLVCLLLHRGSASKGYVNDPDECYPGAISRFRRRINEQVATGVGAELVETGLGGEYRLCPKAKVTCDVSFGPIPRFLSKAEADDIRSRSDEGIEL